MGYDIIDKIQAMTQRLDRAKELVMSGKVIQASENEFVVRSQAGKGEYQVNAAGCNCPDAQKAELTKGICKHRLATLLWLRHSQQTSDQAEGEQSVADLDDPSQAKTDTRPFTPAIDWCSIHNEKMRSRTNDYGSWYSHKNGQGWCNGRMKKEAA